MSYTQNGLPARRVAYDILNQIFFRRRNFDEAFAKSDVEDLAGRDRAFVRLLVSLVLKRTGQIDKILSSLLRDPIDKLKPPQLVNIFRLGLVQYIFLETPAHAAVNTTVELAEAEGIQHLKPLVNAVMRTLTREDVPQFDVHELAALNTPEWLWNTWVEDFGKETATAIATANLNEVPLDFSIKTDTNKWAATLEARVMPTGTVRKDAGGFIPDMEGFDEGAWWIQNASAALPAKLLGDVNGKDVIDLCAAPGGKTAQLLSMGARVIALDRSSARTRKLDENMERLQLSVETVIADGAEWLPKEKADAVLLDAPCTATGTIRHQPDVLHLKGMQDQDKLSALQKRLFVNAVEMLKTGGVLIYCTCSLQKAESEDITTWALAQGLPIEFSPFVPEDLNGISEMIAPRGDLRCMPFHWQDRGGLDGFYIARFVRV